MLERLTTMRQEIDNAASRCENLGSTDNLDETDLPENTPIYQLAEQVNVALQHATEEVRVYVKYLFIKMVHIISLGSMDSQRTVRNIDWSTTVNFHTVLAILYYLLNKIIIHCNKCSYFRAVLTAKYNNNVCRKINSKCTVFWKVQKLDRKSLSKQFKN